MGAATISPSICNKKIVAFREYPLAGNALAFPVAAPEIDADRNGG